MWPKLKENAAGVEPVYVFDRKRPPGHLCQLTSEEIWKLQGRSVVDLNKGALMEQMVCEGCRATGAQSAASLLLWAGDVMEMIMEERATKAGMCAEVEGPESLALKFWFGSANGEEETTGGEQEEDEVEQVFWANRWTEAWWISMLDDEITSTEDEAEEDCRAGGRKPRKIAEEVAEVVSKQFVTGVRLAVRPFCREVGDRVEWKSGWRRTCRETKVRPRCVGEVASMGEETAMVVRVFGQVGKHGRAGEQAVRFCGLLGLAGSVGEHHQAEHLRHQDGPQACGGRGCPGWHAPGVDLAGGPGSTFYDPASSAVGGHAMRCYNVSARS